MAALLGTNLLGEAADAGFVETLDSRQVPGGLEGPAPLPLAHDPLGRGATDAPEPYQLIDACSVDIDELTGWGTGSHRNRLRLGRSGTLRIRVT